MMKKKRYMTYAERLKLEALREAKIPVQEIARQLGFSRQTIYNELKRGAYTHDCGWYDEIRYSADKAQQIHNQRQTAKGRPLKIGNDHAYANFLERKILHEHFSPAAALASARKEGFTTRICVGTLYNYISGRVFLTLTEVFPDAKYQRCTVHFYRNVFSVVPRSKVKLVAKMLKAIHAQESKKAAREKAKAVVAQLKEMKLKEAAKKVEDSVEETLTYCDFPYEHWTRIRTNNVIERLNREIRRRTRVVGTFPDGNSALMLVCARLRHVAGTQWATRNT